MHGQTHIKNFHIYSTLLLDIKIGDEISTDMCFMKIGAGKVALFLSAPIKLHVYRQTLWRFESKERLDNVRVLRHCVHHLQSRHFVSTSTLTLQPSKPPIQCTRGVMFLGSKDLSVKLVNSYYNFIERCLIQKKITFILACIA